jgi:DNA-binding Lrp family transcriptional regulator
VAVAGAGRGLKPHYRESSSSIGRADPRNCVIDFGETTMDLVKMKVSAADELLLSVLRENARASIAEIARRLGLSRTTVQSRIERLERQGVISGYTVRLADEVEHGHIRAHIMITVRPKQMPAVTKALRAMPQVRVLHSVSGPYDLVALGTTPTVGEMDVLTDRIGAIDGVERTTSSIVLSTKFER